MKEEQKNKMFSILSDILIPAIIETQINNLYPFEFVYVFNPTYQLKILNGEVIVCETIDLNYRNARRNFRGAPYHFEEPAPPIIVDIKQIKDLKIPSFNNSKLNDLPFVLKSISQCMIEHLKVAETYQKEIQEIFHFSKTVLLHKTRIVLLEKIF